MKGEMSPAQCWFAKEGFFKDETIFPGQSCRDKYDAWIWGFVSEELQPAQPGAGGPTMCNFNTDMNCVPESWLYLGLAFGLWIRAVSLGSKALSIAQGSEQKRFPHLLVFAAF